MHALKDDFSVFFYGESNGGTIQSLESLCLPFRRTARARGGTATVELNRFYEPN
jgi:hypothetical protein